jgi:hypothetical protein
MEPRVQLFTQAALMYSATLDQVSVQLHLATCLNKIAPLL